MAGSYGPTLIDSVIQYLSASGISAGDPTQPGGCLRRWFYRYVLGIKEPFTGDKRLGVKVHNEIEHLLRTGEVTLGHIAMAARHFIPNPNDSFLVEQEIKGWEVTCAGIPVIGKIDFVNPNSVHIDAQGSLAMDPPGTIEVNDWKTTSNIARWAKTGADLKKTIQMPLYGTACAREFDAEHVRLSHVYMQTRGRTAARKSTILVTRDELEKRWEQIEDVARTLIDVATETDVAKVPASRHSCSAYSGCFFSDRCPRSRTDTLESVFGVTKARQIQGEDMSTVQQQLAAMQAQAPATVAPAPAEIPLAQVIAEVEALDQGFPSMNAELSIEYAKIKGMELSPGAAFTGLGKLGTIPQPLSIVQLRALHADACRKAPTVPAPAPVAPPVTTAQPALPSNAVGLIPPEAPASDPALAALPVDRFSAPPAATAPPPPAPAPTPAVAQYADAATPPTERKPAPTDGMPNYKRMNKGPLIEACEALYTEINSLRAAMDVGTVVNAPAPAGIVLHINALPSEPHDNLADYVRGICKTLEEQTGAKDIRLSDTKALDFGKWRGALAAMVRDTPPEPGVYYLDTRGDEIAAEVAAALIPECARYVRGL
jgi:hypothetical protein